MTERQAVMSKHSRSSNNENDTTLHGRNKSDGPFRMPVEFGMGGHSSGQGAGQNERTSGWNDRRHQGYDFDSCISTEEAFFGIGDSKYGGQKQTETNTGSNPQEDSTPKARRFHTANRRTQQSFNRGSTDPSTANQAKRMKFLFNRQRTQRFEPKGVSMAGRERTQSGRSKLGSTPSNKKDQKRGRNQSHKLLDNLNDDSNGTNSKERTRNASELKNRKQSPAKLNVLKRQSSNQNVKGYKDATPLIRKQSSRGILRDDSSSELGRDDGSLLHQSVSRQSLQSPSDADNIRRFLDNNGNINSRQIRGGVSGTGLIKVDTTQQASTTNIGSERVIGGITQPIVSHAGQASMKLDMKFGWRPQLDKEKSHRKEAIAIKLGYPNNQDFQTESVRNSALVGELYKFKKSYRALKTQAKKNFVPDFPSKVVYQGYRPKVSLELHMRYGQKAGFNEDSQFYDVLLPKNIKTQAIEHGLHRLTPRSLVNESNFKAMEGAQTNQPQPCEITFDSTFESGNLDLAVQVQPREFNLYLKPDTNTKGYCNWFFFKIKRKPDEKGKFPKASFQFNIMNMYKKKTLYKLDARPLACFQEIHHKGFMMQELENVSWKTSHFSNIGYALVTPHPSQQANKDSTPKATANQSLGENFGMARTQSQTSQITALKEQTLVPGEQNQGNARKQKYFCLSFDFQFQSGQEFVYIASSIPYPYTFLQKTIKTCQRLDQAMTTLTRSLGGLQIPMLTITNEVVNSSKKRTVIICGRIHPGETNSSWILHGIIDYLISKDASHLRDSIIFKIVPMTNPDGVVAGNYRTSFIGKDLNRLYLQNDEAESRYNNMDDILKPEITAMKQLIQGCKTDNSKGILAFIDVHHHSGKRGAFMFGPSYQMHHSKHQEVRVLPKLISMMLPEMFRFQSCRFKNQSYKENCARLFCDKEVGITYSYCLECSQQGYFTQTTTKETEGDRMTAPARYRHIKYFDQNSLMFLGRKICEATYMLNEMSEQQDLKRDAIQKRRRMRMKGKKKGGANKSMAGKSHMKNSKAGDQGSMYGATDFDMDSDLGKHSSNLSTTSHDFMQAGINPKMDIKGFIAQMMNKQPPSGAAQQLSQDSSRGALRHTNKRPLTHFGSEDAVSEKSAKEEESLSEGSDDGSDAQDLSADEQDRVLDQVLDQLMPNRVKKIDPVSAQITVTKNIIKQPVELPQRPVRRNLKSANRIVQIDKKLIQKEQLLIPKAVPDLQVGSGTVVPSGGVTDIATKGPILGDGLIKTPQPVFEEARQYYVVPVSQQKAQEDAKKVVDKNLAKVLVRPQKKQKSTYGVSVPGQNQGYVSQRNKQHQRVASSYANRPAVVSKGDLFANSRQPVKRLTSTNTTTAAPTQSQKVKYQNIYSMVTQNRQANTAVNSPDKGDQRSIYNPVSDIHQRKSQEDIQQAIVNRKSSRTAGQLQHSFSHTKDQMTDKQQPHLNQVTGPVTRSSFSRLKLRSEEEPAKSLRAMTSDLTAGQQQNQTQTFFKPSGHQLDSQWTKGIDDKQIQAKDNVVTSPVKRPPRPNAVNQPLSYKTPQKAANSSKIVALNKTGSAKKALGNMLKSNDLFNEPSAVDLNEGLTSPDMNQDIYATTNQVNQAIDRTSIPLSQGGFFHRNQLINASKGLQDNTTIQRKLGGAGGTTVHSPPDVIIRSKAGYGQSSQTLRNMAAKRNSFMEQSTVTGIMNRNISKTNAQTTAAPIGSGYTNRITHKRPSHLVNQQNANIMASSPQQSTNNFIEKLEQQRSAVVSAHHNRLQSVRDRTTFLGASPEWQGAAKQINGDISPPTYLSYSNGNHYFDQPSQQALNLYSSPQRLSTGMIEGMETKTRQQTHHYTNTVVVAQSRKTTGANNPRSAKKTDALLVSGPPHRSGSSMMLSSDTTLALKPQAAAQASEKRFNNRQQASKPPSSTAMQQRQQPSLQQSPQQPLYPASNMMNSAATGAQQQSLRATIYSTTKKFNKIGHSGGQVSASVRPPSGQAAGSAQQLAWRLNAGQVHDGTTSNNFNQSRPAF